MKKNHFVARAIRIARECTDECATPKIERVLRGYWRQCRRPFDDEELESGARVLNFLGKLPPRELPAAVKYIETMSERQERRNSTQRRRESLRVIRGGLG